MSSLLDDALSTLSAVAPGIATAFGGPVAGLAVQAVESALGASPSGDKDAALQAVSGATPDQLLALKKADQDFQTRMKELDIQYAQIDESDRDSARKRQEAVKDWIPGVLAVSLTLGFFGLLASLVVHAPPEGSRDIVHVMLGSLGTGWVTMLAYYYGSSNDAARQSQAVAPAAQ